MDIGMGETRVQAMGVPEESNALQPTQSPGAASSPSMQVADPLHEADPPLGLYAPLPLLGGDRFGNPGIAASLGCEWNVELLDAIAAAETHQQTMCRHWFRMDPVILTGPRGAGRTQVARRIAWAAGVPHIPINVAGKAQALGAARRGPTPALPSIISMGMAVSRCANPIIDVSGVEDADADVLERLALLIDPVRGRLFDEALDVAIDLSEATWLIQLPPSHDVPPQLKDLTSVVTLALPTDDRWMELAWIESLSEAAYDLDARDALKWLTPWTPTGKRPWLDQGTGALNRYREAVATIINLKPN